MKFKGESTHDAICGANGAFEDADASTSLFTHLLHVLSLTTDDASDLQNGDDQAENTLSRPPRPFLRGQSLRRGRG